MVTRFLAFLLFFLFSAAPAFADQPPIGWLHDVNNAGVNGTAPIVLITADPSAPAGRTLTVEGSLTLTDNGPGNTVQVGTNTVLDYFHSTGATTNQTAFNAFSTLPSSATGDIWYHDTASTVARRAIGSPGDVLTVSGGVPVWAASSGGAPANAQYILGTNDGTLTQDRAWLDGSGITHTDGGANSTWSVAVDSTVIRTTGAQSMAGPKTLSGGPIISGMASTGLVLTGASFSTTLLTDPGSNQSVTIPTGINGASLLASVGAPATGSLIIGAGAAPQTTLAIGTSGKILQTNGTTPGWTSFALPTSVGGTGTLLRSNGTNYVVTTLTMPDTIASGTIFRASSANVLAATAYTMPSAAGTSGKILQSDGTNLVMSTPTFPTAAGTSGKILVSDGTNIVSSTPTFPNASATSRKIIVSDGTNWVASTETYAVPGTSGNVLTSNGTNWTSAVPASGGTVTSVAQSLTSLGFMSISGSPITTSGTLALAASGTTGDTIYFSGANATSKLAIGSTGQVLKVAGGVPSWGTDSTGFGGQGTAGATTKGATTETTPLMIDATTFTQTVSTTYAPVSGSVYNCTSTADWNGTTNVGAGYSGAASAASGKDGSGLSPGGGGTSAGGGGGGNGGAGGAGAGSGGGIGGVAVPFEQSPGSGGGGGTNTAGGAGGGRLTCCAVGAITIGGSGTINAAGTAGTADTANGGDGAGGGAGGVVFLASQTSITQTGTASVAGGAGGAGGASGANSYGGGGGGGGWYVRISPSNSGAGVITVTGGAGGSANTAAGTAGSNGTAMAITATPNLPLMGSLERNYKMLAALHRIHEPGTHLNIKESELINTLAALDSKGGDFANLCHLYRHGEDFQGSKVVQLDAKRAEKMEALRNAS
jgi:hypothetical protein